MTPINHHDHDDHYFHHDAPYVEPDYYATDVNRNFPILSTVGRGPRGYGVSAEIIKQADGTFIYRIYNDETGETIFTSPNLSAGQLSITQDTHKPVPGEVAHATVHVLQNGKTTSYDLYLPPGAEGSRIYLAKDWLPRSSEDTYLIELADLTYDGLADWKAKPAPRVHDVVIFTTYKDKQYWLACGYVQAYANPTTVVVTAREFIKIVVPNIDPSTGNWFIDGVDTGVHAQGPKGDKGTYSTPTIEEVGSYDPIEIIDLDPDPTNAQLHFKIPMAKMILIQAELASVADLPPFKDTPVGWAYLVDHTSDLQYDLYYRGPNAQPDTDWIIVKDWQGVPAKVITGDTYHLPWGEDARVEGTPQQGNEVQFDFYIPDTMPDNLITANSPITVTEDSGKFLIEHERSGAYLGTYPNPEYPTSSRFGGHFYVPRFTVDITGHITYAGDFLVTHPWEYATQTDPGLMSPEDKIKLDTLDGIIPVADGVTIIDNSGTWSAIQQDVSVPTIPVSWIQENFVL